MVNTWTVARKKYRQGMHFCNLMCQKRVFEVNNNITKEIHKSYRLYGYAPYHHKQGAETKLSYTAVPQSYLGCAYTHTVLEL